MNGFRIFVTGVVDLVMGRKIVVLIYRRDWSILSTQLMVSWLLVRGCGLRLALTVRHPPFLLPERLEQMVYRLILLRSEKWRVLFFNHGLRTERERERDA
ncbi:hypothetical protein L1049_026759 [Liquidambar formosana]|uniref:Uncharacterized protein n=1 Tax=Liquidambar formosana TaxID=63359 RepID=A0AAP0R6P3_LIQFO